MPSGDTRTVGSTLRKYGLRLWGLTIVGYLAAIGVCTALGVLWPAALVLVALFLTALIRALVLENRAEAIFLASILVLIVVVLIGYGPEKAIGLTLAVVQAMVAALFLRSLRGPKSDIITQIACAIRARRTARELDYTRNVCKAWGALMLVMAAVSLAFTFFAPPRIWWTWKLFGCWAVPVGFFILEWLLRQWILRQEHKKGFKSGFRQSLRAVARIDFAHLFEL
ncbi:MAG: hypothetical protein L0I62_04885 [Gammaproteobacteria bacterium]|nr:hypothetical protein [Gammaproteobacteria bacterium]